MPVVKISPILPRITSILGWLTLFFMIAALIGAFIYAPTERIQGDVQRIFYFHVPLAWVAFLAYFIVFLGGIFYLWKRSEVWDRLANASAIVGVLFTTLVLITGSIWGKPIWGAWWAWDPRLTSSCRLHKSEGITAQRWGDLLDNNQWYWQYATLWFVTI